MLVPVCAVGPWPVILLILRLVRSGWDPCVDPAVKTLAGHS